MSSSTTSHDLHPAAPQPPPVRPAAHASPGAAGDASAADTDWVAQRKHAIIMAALPRTMFGGIYEPGCGMGELTLSLAARCTRLVASDLCEEAVEATRARTQGMAHVDVRREHLPEQWPALSNTMAEFDLVVLSEFCYYFDAMQMAELAALAAASLAEGGYLLACHWKREFDDRLLATATAHAVLDRHARLRRQVCYEDDDFLLHLWQKRLR